MDRAELAGVCIVVVVVAAEAIRCSVEYRAPTPGPEPLLMLVVYQMPGWQWRGQLH